MALRISPFEDSTIRSRTSFVGRDPTADADAKCWSSMAFSAVRMYVAAIGLKLRDMNSSTMDKAECAQEGTHLICVTYDDLRRVGGRTFRTSIASLLRDFHRAPPPSSVPSPRKPASLMMMTRGAAPPSGASTNSSSAAWNEAWVAEWRMFGRSSSRTTR